MNVEGAEELMGTVIEHAVKDSVDRYKRNENNFSNEYFFKNSFMVHYMLPDLDGDLIINALKARARYNV